MSSLQSPRTSSFGHRRDKNGDGKLSPDELPAALFDRLDADNNGFVTEEEFKALWRTKR